MLKYTEKQAAGYRHLADPSKRRILLDGGARSGKTELIWDWIVERALYYPRSWHLVLRKYRQHTKQALWNGTMSKYLQQHIDEQGHKGLYRLNKDELVLNWKNGSRILFEGCDDEARVRNLFGNEYATIWFNEASEFQWKVVDELMSRAAQRCNVVDEAKGRPLPSGYPLPEILPVKVVFDTNPRGRRHWLYKVGVLNVNPETGERLPDAETWGRLGGWSPYDNAAHISPDALKTYEAMVGVNRKRLLDGEWCENTGAVYAEFQEDVHVCTECTGRRAPEHCPRVWKQKSGGAWVWRAGGCWRGIDFGYRDPFVCLWAARVGETLLFYRCHYEREKIVSDHAAAINRLTLPGEPVRWTVADHDAADAATLRREGISSRPAKKDRPIMAGIDRVKKRMRVVNGVPGVQVCKYLTPMLDEITSYMMDKNSEKDRPEDGNDHAMDTMRYMIAELDGRGGSMVVGL